MKILMLIVNNMLKQKERRKIAITFLNSEQHPKNKVIASYRRIVLPYQV